MGISNFLTEFGYWLMTDDGTYYRELCAAYLVFSIYFLIILGDVAYAFATKNFDFLILGALFGYFSYKKLKKIIKLHKDKTW